MNKRLKLLRKKLKLTQTEFSNELGVKRSAYSMIETGKNPLSDRYIKAICMFHNVSEVWLRTGEGEMFTPTLKVNEIINTFNCLSPSLQDYVIVMMKELLKVQEQILFKQSENP